MAAVLLQVLERTELNKLPKAAQNKLESSLLTSRMKLNPSKRSTNGSKADCEQQYFDVEKRLVESQEQFVSHTRITRLSKRRTANSHCEKLMEQEKQLQQNQNTWLNSELKTKTEELLSVSREKGKEILELKCSLEGKRDEVTRLQTQVTNLKNSSENLQKLVEDLMTKLKEAKDQQSTMEEKYRSELNAHIKHSPTCTRSVSDPSNGAASDAEYKNEELNRAVEEVRKLVKEAGNARQTIEKKLADMEGSKGKQEAELKEKIKKMEEELENANLRASDKRSMGFPRAGRSPFGRGNLSS
ncbi:hypothetical protein J4Q44_G00185700 [Coregonus suidteri]|uniref:Nucleoprotein TPR/MPL1 domain-containing protein n=1 Tax=Coregonus suidteri TaxID=861788 RepID=A0AAN8LG50_9TELE